MAPNLPNGVAKQLPCFTREEVFQHRKQDDCWIILHGEVYNVTPWLSKHPGGAKLLLHYGGEDATVRKEELARLPSMVGGADALICV